MIVIYVNNAEPVFKKIFFPVIYKLIFTDYVLEYSFVDFTPNLLHC
jgi:hypothetical protein